MGLGWIKEKGGLWKRKIVWIRSEIMEIGKNERDTLFIY